MYYVLQRPVRVLVLEASFFEVQTDIKELIFKPAVAYVIPPEVIRMCSKTLIRD
jgi:hypothetical protein